MKIEIRDYMGNMHVIQSENPAIIGLWFAEITGKLMSVNSNYAYQTCLQVWPTTDAEQKTIGHSAQIPMTEKLLEDLADVLNKG